MNAHTPETRFSFERFALLVRNRLYDDAPAFATASAAVFALSLLFSVLRSRSSFDGPMGSSAAWPFLIVVGGVLLAGRAFERMHNGAGGTEWLLLPASTEEKYLAAVASYFVVYPVAATLAAVVVSALLSLIGLALGSVAFAVWNPFAAFNWRSAAAYPLIVSFALAGSARFRKLALVKTAALSFSWIVFLGFLGMALLFLFVSESRGHFGPRGRFFASGIDLPAWKTAALETVSVALRVVSFVGALLYGYFRVAEKEAVDEVQ